MLSVIFVYLRGHGRSFFAKSLGSCVNDLSFWKIIPGRILPTGHATGYVSAAGRLWSALPYSFKISPNNFYPSGPLRRNPPGKRLAWDAKVKQAINICLKELDIDFIYVEIQHPGRSCYKCLDINVDIGRSGGYHLVGTIRWVPCGGYHMVGTIWWVPYGGYQMVGTIWWVPCGGYHMVGTICCTYLKSTYKSQ